MGFDPAWLALRAPADARARDQGLLARAIAHAGVDGPVLDLGCGTGATTRAFAAAGAAGLNWRLLDNDPALLQRARQHHPEADIRHGDLTDIAALPLDGLRLVTASALLDLVSEDWARRLADRLHEQRIAFHAALSYDGIMRWTPEDRRDAEVTRRFNRHQRGDKGFGPAMGPEAGPRMGALLRARGYRVDLAPSPWRLGPSEAALQRELLTGIVKAAQEAGLAAAEARDWAANRRTQFDRGSVDIGHVDLLALPAEL